MKKKQDSGKSCANLVLLIMIIPVVIFVSWLFDGIGWGLLMGFILFMVGTGGDFWIFLLFLICMIKVRYEVNLQNSNDFREQFIHRYFIKIRQQEKVLYPEETHVFNFWNTISWQVNLPCNLLLCIPGVHPHLSKKRRQIWQTLTILRRKGICIYHSKILFLNKYWLLCKVYFESCCSIIHLNFTFPINNWLLLYLEDLQSSCKSELLTMNEPKFSRL